jgi:hypothetical protein
MLYNLVNIIDNKIIYNILNSLLICLWIPENAKFFPEKANKNKYII